MAIAGEIKTRRSMSVNWIACGKCYTKTKCTELGGIELQRSSNFYKVGGSGGDVDHLRGHSDVMPAMVLCLTHYTWSSTWKLSFNPSKCRVLHITKKKSSLKHTYYLHGSKLSESDVHPYLGVQIRNTLRWNEHIDYI